MPHSTTPSAPRIVLGTAGFGSSADPQAKFNDASTTTPLLDLFRAHGHKELDTARAYPIGAGGTAGACPLPPLLSQIPPLSPILSPEASSQAPLPPGKFHHPRN